MDKSEIKDPNEDVSSSSDEECGSSSSGSTCSTNCSCSSSSSGSSSGSSSSSSESETDKSPAPKKQAQAIAVGAPKKVLSSNDLDKKIDALVADLEKHCREQYKGRLVSEFKAVMPPVQGRKLAGIDKVFCLSPSTPVELAPFDENKFQSALKPEDLKDKESRDAFVSRLKTTIRWRVCQDKETGAFYKESNTRIVRWSDGTETLHIGAEAFNVVNGTMPLGQSQLYVRQSSHHYLLGPVREKATLQTMLESNSYQTDVQGSPEFDFPEPELVAPSTNPVLDPERTIIEERREQSDKRREQKAPTKRQRESKPAQRGK